MKILLSAYACSPGKGSEQGVGWNWAVQLKNLSHEVYVLTRSNNQIAIEADNSGNGIKFIYYDLPVWIIRLKKYIGVQIYYVLWQFFACRILEKTYKKNYFDIVHHITFVSFRFPTFIYKLGGKFILGPIGGGEEGTIPLIKSLPPIYQILEYFRIFFNYANRYNIFINKAYKSAAEIYVTTNATFDKIPFKFQNKTKIAPAIGIENIDTVPQFCKGDKFVILFAGNLLHWKGAHLAILSLASIKDINPNVILKIVGNGHFHSYLKSLVLRLGLSDRVIFIPYVPQKELFKIYQTSHLFLFPSFHDSGGFVVLEAMSFGLPVICINQGGPADIVGKNSENVVDVNGKTIDEIIQLLSMRLRYFIEKPERIFFERDNLKYRIAKYSWPYIVSNIYK